MCVGAALSLAATRLGAGATPDTGHYLAVAQNLLDGRGYVRLGPEIMASWPPLYPTVLAAGKLVGLDPLVWARILNAALFAGCVFIVVIWVGEGTRSRAAAAAAGALAALGAPLVYVSSLALTELPFITAVLAALHSLDAWAHRQTRRNMAWCIAWTAVACLIRYQGLALVGTLATSAVLLGQGPLVRRLLTAGAASVVSALPLAAWLLRNALLTGQPMGPRFASEYGLAEAAADLGRNAMSWFVPWRILLAHQYAGILLLVGACAAALILSRRREEAWRAVVICVTFAAGFAAMMLAAVTRTSMDPLADRILSPLYPCLVIAAVIAATQGVRALPSAPFRAAASALLLAGGLLSVLARTGPQVAESWREGPGGAAHSNFNTAEWRASPTLHWARENVRGLAFASTPAALYLVSGVDSRPMPRKHARRSPNVPMDRLADLHRDVAAAGSAYLVISEDHVPSHAFSLRELEEAFTLSEVARFADGVVYVMRPRPTVGTPGAHVSPGAGSKG